jgi:hypothetical protein
MLKFYKFLLFFSLLFFGTTSHATHMMGGSLTYRSLGNNQYLLIGKIFRDCRGVPVTPPYFGWYAGANGSNSCGTDSITSAKSIKIQDITYTCASKSSPCSPQNRIAKEGAELHTFEAIIDLSTSPYASILAKSGCTELTFFMGQCCRNKAITTGSADEMFFVTCQLNIGNLRKCKNKVNSSAAWNNNPNLFACCNTPHYYNPGVNDSVEMDSISFHLVPGIATLPSTLITYISPFTYLKPLTPNCTGGGITCTPNIQVSPPKGFYFDTTNGDIIFTPAKCDEVAVVAMEAREWRKDSTGKRVLIGVTRQDVQFIIKDNCGYNNPPIITGTFKNKVTAGDSLCLVFNGSDAIFSPHQTKPDSIQVSCFGESAKPKIKLTYDASANRVRVDFCWQTTNRDTSTRAHFFTLFMKDDHCDKNAAVSRGFTVLVQPRDSSWFDMNTKLKCNAVECKGATLRSKSSPPSFVWRLLDSASGKLVKQGSGSNYTLGYVPKGSYAMIMQASSEKYGYSEVKKYFRIDTDAPGVSLSPTRLVCKSDSITFTATPVFLKAPTSVRWYVNYTEDPNAKGLTYHFDSVTTTKRMIIVMRDADGCEPRDSAFGLMVQRPKVSWSSDPLAATCHASGDILLQNAITSPPDSVQKTGTMRIWGSLTNYGNTGLVDSISPQQHILRVSKTNNETELQNGKYIQEYLTMEFTDSNGCESMANTSINIHGSPILETVDKVLCQNLGGELNLDSLVLKPKIKFGAIHTWSAVNAPSGVNKSSVIVVRNHNGIEQYWFQFGSKGLNQFAGDYDLNFSVTDATTGCNTMDTTRITLNPQPVMQTRPYSGHCTDSGYMELTDLFLADGKNIDTGSSKLRIKAFNGNTDTTKWKNVRLLNGHLFPKFATFGKYTIHCDNWTTGCLNSITNDVLVFANPLVSFTTSPADSAPITLPYFTTYNKTTIGSSDAMNYLWYTDYPSISSRNTSIAPVISYPSKYAFHLVRLIGTSSKGCIDSFDKILQVGTWINALRGANSPNFFIDQKFTIHRLEFQKIETRVFDGSGKLVGASCNNTPIGLKPGLYFYRINIWDNHEKPLLINGKMVVNIAE